MLEHWTIQGKRFVFTSFATDMQAVESILEQEGSKSPA